MCVALRLPLPRWKSSVHPKKILIVRPTTFFAIQIQQNYPKTPSEILGRFFTRESWHRQNGSEHGLENRFLDIESIGSDALSTLRIIVQNSWKNCKHESRHACKLDIQRNPLLQGKENHRNSKNHHQTVSQHRKPTSIVMWECMKLKGSSSIPHEFLQKMFYATSLATIRCTHRYRIPTFSLRKLWCMDFFV